MPTDNGTLTPTEASLAALNVYYTLKGWARYTKEKGEESESPTKPTPGMETKKTMKKQITGSGQHSLGQTDVGGGTLTKAFKATTGVGVSSGFGYIYQFTHGGKSHVIVATRGTRMEMGPADLITDFYFTPTSTFLDAGPIHRGFAVTFESMRETLDNADDVFSQADYIHCAGHSLGGAIANLSAYYLHSKYPDTTVRLYTWGAPRVGVYFGLPDKLEKGLGKSNIYRVSRHMDLISMIPIFPFLHVLGADNARNNIILPSKGKVPNIGDHNMVTYCEKMRDKSWSAVRGERHLPSFEDRMMKNIWENDKDGWFKKGAKLVGGAALWLLMKVFKGILKLLGGAIIVLVASPLDLLARLIYAGVRELGKMGKAILGWLSEAAEWIGIKIKSAVDITTEVCRKLLLKIWGGMSTVAEAMLQGLASIPPSAFVPPIAMGVGMSNLFPF